jgi:hypothetical protein
MTLLLIAVSGGLGYVMAGLVRSGSANQPTFAAGYCVTCGLRREHKLWCPER